MMSNYNEVDYSSIGNISVHSSGLNSLSPYLNLDPAFLRQSGEAEFVFPEDAKKRRGWGERMFSTVGTSYLIGLGTGGSFGFYEGLRSSLGTTMKLRGNSILNGCTRRGPFLANSFSVLALMYGCSNAAFEKVRGVEDEYNSLVAATATGALFKSTAGIRAVAKGGAIGGCLAVAYFIVDVMWNVRPLSWSTVKDEITKGFKIPLS